MDKKLRILFISHDSTVTGAPILLLNLLQLLLKNGSIDFEVLLYRGGALEENFKNRAPVSVLKDTFYASEKKFVKRLFNYLRYQIKVWRWKGKVKNFDIVFSNTIANGKLLQQLPLKKVFVVSYVHELESVIRQYKKEAQLTFGYSDLIAYPSIAVYKNLFTRHQISDKKLVRLDYYFPIEPGADPHSNGKQAREQWCLRYGLSNEKFLVVSMGTATYRKGIDLFVKTASTLKEHSDILFVWIGDFIDGATKADIMDQIKEFELSENILITGFQPPSLSALQPFDLFLLTSKEDPYPLVTIEAAFNRLPVLAFKSGGIEDFVQDHCGWLVNDFSPADMADKILELKKDPLKINITGENAFIKAMDWHANEGRILDQLKTIFQNAAL